MARVGFKVVWTLSVVTVRWLVTCPGAAGSWPCGEAEFPVELAYVFGESEPNIELKHVFDRSLFLLARCPEEFYEYMEN